MGFTTVGEIAARMQQLGAARVLFKVLAANDNAKQQVYFGGSFEVVRVIPTGQIRAEGAGAGGVLKAAVNLWWLDDEGRSAQARGAQLILYPQYPEVRLSGFLRGCAGAPSKLMSPTLRSAGRVLFLGIASDRVYAYVASAPSAIAQEGRTLAEIGGAPKVASIFFEVPLSDEEDTSARDDLLSRLAAIHREGWIESFRLNGAGQAVACSGTNCGGLTLEGKFGIIPNSKAQPDFRGWELKAFSNSPITLLTPEPTLGYYGVHKVAKFLLKYGWPSSSTPGRRDFTGLHRVGKTHANTKLTLTLSGFDSKRSKIVDPLGGILLMDALGEVAAGWSFVDLLDHWKSKHSQTALVKCENRKVPTNEYRYGPTVYLASDAPFQMYLKAMDTGIVYYDPAPKSEEKNGKVTVKARSQFRTTLKQIPQIFSKFETVLLK